MQSALRSATRRAVGISSRRGVATTTTAATKAATASELERDWMTVKEQKEWVTALVQREVRAQMAEEEEGRRTRDLLRAVAEEARRRQQSAFEVELRTTNAAFSFLGGWIVGGALLNCYWILMLSR